jgi:hypothetical protein
MPRRAPFVVREIPLFLIAHIVMREVRKNGEEIERIIIQRTSQHFYNIGVRTKSVKRELKGKRIEIKGESEAPKEQAFDIIFTLDPE